MLPRVDGSAKFASTRWSLVRAAGQKPTPDSRRALAELCGLYWYPLYAFVRRDGVTSDDANDLTQAFFTRLLETNDLATVDPRRGKFRSWLLACMKHFRANDLDRQRAAKRGGGIPAVSIDADQAEGQYQLEPSHNLTPENLFERAWTLRLLERGLNALRDECATDGNAELFEQLKPALTFQSDRSYSELGAALGKKEGAVKTAVCRLRNRYGELVRDEVAGTVEHPENAAEVEDELRRLFEGLGEP
jgi:RNA polymerase sigma-70 factor (ECF subfamily)